MHRNPNYFRADEGLPRFEFLTYRFTGEDTAGNLKKLLSGQCDLLEQNAHIDDQMAEFLELDNDGALQLITSPGTTFEHIDFGIVPAVYDNGYQVGERPDFFGDVRTRHALAMCINRQAIANTLYLGLSEVIHTYIPDSHPLFNPNTPLFSYDPKTGKTLLSDVGWLDDDSDPATPRVARSIPNIPDGTPFSIHFWTTDAIQRHTVSQLLAGDLSLCGIELNIEYWKPEDFFANGPDSPVFGRQFEMVEFAWLSGMTPPCHLYLSENIPGPPDARNPDGTLRFPAGWGEPRLGDTPPNNMGYFNPAFDEACQRGLALLPDEPGYVEAHQEAQAIWIADLPSIPLYLRIKMGAARADFCGFEMNPTARSDTWNIEKFGYGEICPDS